LKGVGEGRGFVAQYAWYQSNETVAEYGSCQFTPRKYIVAYGYFMGNKQFPNPLVNALVMSAEDNNILKQR
jgi:hypothetical protein